LTTAGGNHLYCCMMMMTMMMIRLTLMSGAGQIKTEFKLKYIQPIIARSRKSNFLPTSVIQALFKLTYGCLFTFCHCRNLTKMDELSGTGVGLSTLYDFLQVMHPLDRSTTKFSLKTFEHGISNSSHRRLWSAMLPLDRALLNSYRLSVVTVPLSVSNLQCKF